MQFTSVLRGFYSLGFYLGLPLILLRLLWRARLAPDYAKRLHERFALIRVPLQAQRGIWLHAVSLGEVIAAKPLLQALQQQYPHLPLVVTTTTPTGSKRLQEMFAHNVYHVYLPYDLPDAVHRFLRRVKPRVGIIMETELWPNLYHAAQVKRIPLMLANARLSPTSTRGYGRILQLTREMLQTVKQIAAQSAADANNFLQLGARAEHVQVAGNLKFNQVVPAGVQQQGLQLRQQWGGSRPVWIAASTHEGEEAQVLRAHALIKTQFPTALLLLVPRHAERFDKVVVAVKQAGYQVAQRSQNNADLTTEVFVGDSMGEMMTFYAASDLAFVGGSLMPIGGHNPLEPMALNIPTLMGPHTFNMQAMADLLLQADAMIRVDDAESLAANVVDLLGHQSESQTLARNAQQLLAANQQALDKHMRLVEQLLASV